MAKIEFNRLIMTGKEKCAIMRANCKTVGEISTDINDAVLMKVRNLVVKKFWKFVD